MIGAAPIILGGAFVAYAGLAHLGFDSIRGSLGAAQLSSFGGWAAVWEEVLRLNHQPDFWIWFYLAFAVSSTMLPSASDRRAWLPLALTLGILIALSLLAGAGPWMLSNLAPALNRVFLAMASVLGISAVLHLLILLPVWVIAILVSRLTGLQVVG